MTRRTAIPVAIAVICTVAGWAFLGIIPAASVSILILALYYAVGGTSFNFLYGSLGVFSLAQVVFLAVGGYTDVYLYNKFGVSPWLSRCTGRRWRPCAPGSAPSIRIRRSP